MTQYHAAHAQRLPRPPPTSVPPREPLRQNVNARMGQLGFGRAQNKEVVDLTENATGAAEESPVKRRKLSSDGSGTSKAVERLSPPPAGVKKADENGDGKPGLPNERKSAAPAASSKALGSVNKSSVLDHGAYSLPPLPTRSWRDRPQEVLRIARHEKDRSIPKREVQTMPYKILSPQDAPVMKEDLNLADFFPWKGSHPEDTALRDAVREGFFDKAKLQNETNTARLSLLGACKHRKGLSTLSAIFQSLSERRQARGKVASTSSFKPPPRVTLTEAKRKSWLNDLSNPTVPLRRLSRTIPQGIRGQLLLEQCLANSVPISRAIWFVKCVGANEIRTLKRKGTSTSFAAGAEAKWLKDWTANLQAFVEGSLTPFHLSEWRVKFNYSIELAIRLYRENLVDREHYLDWIIQSVCETTLDLLPTWMLLVRIHFKDLGKFRKRGRQLAEALLEKLYDALQTDSEIFQPIVQKVSHFIRAFALARADCFLLPRTWEKYSRTLASCLKPSIPAENALFNDLNERNVRISRLKSPNEGQTVSWRREVIRILDQAKPPCDVCAVASKCISVQSNLDKLIPLILEWATTSFRTGLARVYLSVRLLRRWHKKGVDIQTPIYRILSDDYPARRSEFDHVQQVVSELVRSRTFSVSRYLQWMTARGNATSLESRELQLLSNIPVHCLPSHIRNLRNTMLAKSGFSASAEDKSVWVLKSSLSQTLPAVFAGSETAAASSGDLHLQIRDLSGSSKSELSYWIRSHVRNYYKCSHSGKKDNPEAQEFSKLTLTEFELLRGVLEEFGDISILADVLSDACNSQDESVLAAATDTLCQHYASMWMIGAFEDLHSALFESYQQLRTFNMPMRNFVVSLIDLSARQQFAAVLPSMLRHDLARGERNAVVSACSPISDHMADSLQNAGSTFVEEFDQLLSTGNSMDDQTMASLFSNLITRLDNVTKDPENQNELLCQMLCRLKAFRVKHFDALTSKWIARMLQAPNQLRVASVLPPLIAFGCVTFGTVFATAKDLLSADATRPGVVQVENVRSALSKVFRCWQRTPSLSMSSVRYRVRQAQHRYVEEHCVEALEMLLVVETHEADPTTQEMLLKCMVHDLEALTELRYSANFANTICSALDHLLLLSDSEVADQVTLPKVQNAVNVCSDLSLPLVQLYLGIAFSRHDIRNELTEILMALALKPNDDTQLTDNLWLPLVSNLDLEAARLLREKAEQSFFLLPSPVIPGQTLPFADTTHDPTIEDMMAKATQYVSIIALTSYSIETTSDSPPAPVGPAVVERLHGYLRYLNSVHSSFTSQASGSAKIVEKRRIMIAFLASLLRLIALHRDNLGSSSPATSATTANGSNSKAEQQAPMKALFALLHIAVHPLLNADIPLVNSPEPDPDEAIHGVMVADPVQYTLDVAALLLDTLSPDTIAKIARLLKDKARDPRIENLVGNMNMLSSSISEKEDGVQPISGFLDHPSTSGSADCPPTLLAMKSQAKEVAESSDRTGSMKFLGEWRPKQWELLEGSNEPSVGLGLFDAVWEKEKSGMAKMGH